MPLLSTILWWIPYFGFDRVSRRLFPTRHPPLSVWISFNAASRFDSLLDPLLYVAPPVTEMTPDSKRRRPLLSVSPRVERLHRHLEVSGKFLDANQPILVFHGSIVPGHPVKRVLCRCHYIGTSRNRRYSMA